MTGGAVRPGTPRVAGLLAAAAVGVAGAAGAVAAGGPAPLAPGAARVAAPDTILALVDTLLLLLVVWPRPGTAGERLRALLPLLAVALPFHVALAAAADAGGGHALAVAAVVAASAAASVVAGGRGAYPVLLALLWLATPLAAYAWEDFAGAATIGGALASPPVAVTVLARDAPGAGLASAVPAVVGALAVALLSLAGRPRRGAAAAAAAAAAVLLAAALTTSVACAGELQVAFDGLVREGRPVTVRAPGVERMRAGTTGPWALPGGAAGDEFVLAAPLVAGGRLELELERGGSREVEAAEVRPWPGVGGAGDPGASFGAHLGGGAGPDDWPVRAVDLPTLREAWLVFDDVRGGAAAAGDLPGAAGAALAAARTGPRAFPFEPLLLPPSMEPFRAAAETAAGAPRLPRDVTRLLVVLGAALAVVAGLVAWTRPAPGRALVAIVLPPLLATAWLVAGGRLPGPVSVTADVLDGATDRLVLVRVSSARGGAVELRAPAGAGVVAAVHWTPEDPGPDADLGPARAVVRLEAGRSALLVYRLPLPPAGAAEDAARDAADERDARGLRSLAAWLRPAGRSVRALGAAPPAALPEAVGARVLPGAHFELAPRR